MAAYIQLSGGTLKEVIPLVASSGFSDAGKIVQTDTNGTLHLSLMSTGVGQDVGVFTAIQNLTAGMFVSINSDGYVRAATYDLISYPTHAQGFILDNVSFGNNVTVYFEGVNNKMSGLTPGIEYFLAYGGDVREPQPTISEGIVQKVGIAISPTEIRFNPTPPVIFTENLPYEPS